ncbi:DUF397 domain-containing protein [Streptomyces sp. NPDC002994]|uniref:DUF397 domain-containing protein n=1 Tax=Streptomyces sp. NPDC002994 TaxID=3154441 RepID=UPI0033B51AAB
MDHEGIRWVKSSYSGGSGTECVEVAVLVGRTAVRDSKVSDGPQVAVRSGAWAGFIHAVRRGELGAG